MGPLNANRLAAWLAEQLGEAGPLALVGQMALGGGCTHGVWRLDLADGRSFCLKINRAESLALFQAEAEGLQALASWSAPPLLIPRPLGLGMVDGQAALLLPWLDLARSGRGGPGRLGDPWRSLGSSLADLHRASAELGPTAATGAGRYGWHQDNFIGSTPQPNGWRSSWGQFFAECRLAPQLQLLRQGGHQLRSAEALLEQVPHWLAGHQPPAVLVHGDLWSGNAALLSDGGGTIFDPAVHWADREVDLAMARLFGGFPEAFFSGYGESWPLGCGAERRIPLYNLYHVLNHANLFGGGYLGQAQQSIDQLLAWLDGD